jgi:hypothetical protein
MANDNKIKRFTAADIEKYHKGQLSANEMHALEKAALDDPFLADALEGYAISGVNTNADIGELQNRLANRIEEENKVVLIAAGKKSFSWWKVAAMIVLIAGAGLIVYQLGFNKKSIDIAQAVQKQAATTEAKDSGKTTSPALLNADTIARSTTGTPEVKKDEAKTELIESNSVDLAKEQSPKKTDKTTPVINDTEAPGNASTVSGAPATAYAEKAKEETLDDAIRQRRVSAARPEEYKTRRLNSDEVSVSPNSQNEKNLEGKIAGISRNNNQRKQAFNQTNIFRGRVTDAYNNALPFSNITNIEDSIGTYSDARGYFTLTSPDSILTVQVRSLGFESDNVQLQNNIPNNQVQLQEDRSSLAEIVISNKKVNSKRQENNTMVLEEPEPADGWTNYDLYLANNLKVPDNFKDKQNGTRGEVELSFEVDKNGEPFNITVKKSLCETCDKEAIRLVKEGPKWKRKARKGKATVKIAF